MANVIAYSIIFQQQIDKVLLREMTTRWMEKTEGVIYQGGNTIKIGKLQLAGLGNYDRNSGFGPNGNMNFSYETFTFDMDRGASFILDAQDVNETNFALNASLIMEEFVRTQVVPEVDAYRYSYLASRLINSGDGTRKANNLTLSTTSGSNTLDPTNFYNTLINDIKNITEYTGLNADIVITVSNSTYAIMQAAGLQFLRVWDKVDDLDVEVMTWNNYEIKVAPDSRMYTSFVFNSTQGAAGNYNNGFTAAGTAKQIYYLITLRTAPIAIVKADVPRIFDPNINQTADAWKIQLRIYHTAILMDNKLNGCFVRIQP